MLPIKFYIIPIVVQSSIVFEQTPCLFCIGLPRGCARFALVAACSILGSLYFSMTLPKRFFLCPTIDAEPIFVTTMVTKLEIRASLAAKPIDLLTSLQFKFYLFFLLF